MPKQRTVLIDGIPVLVTYKKIRSLRLKIDQSGNASASVPVGVPLHEVERFLMVQKDWLRQRIDQKQQEKEALPEREVYHGAQRRILGETVTILIEKADRKRTERVGDEIILKTPSDDPAEWEKQYDAFYLRQARALYEELVTDYTALVEHQDTDIPRVSVRKMSTRWGSCTPAKRTIRLNYYLYEAPLFCVEYVALHEVAHLVYPNHSRQFYGLVSSIMPEYREYKKLLEKSVKIGD